MAMLKNRMVFKKNANHNLKTTGSYQQKVDSTKKIGGTVGKSLGLTNKH